ncbi:MAG: hypothetical protein ACKVWV_06175 [Planctomycetota bacterium]
MRYGLVDSLWWHAPIVVDLEPSAIVERAVELVPAGRIRVRIEDPRGVPRRVAIEVRDDRGEIIPINFVSRLANGGSFGHRRYLGDLGIDVPAVSDPALPPGRYTFLATPDGMVQQSFAIAIEAGVITPLVIQLDGE